MTVYTLPALGDFGHMHDLCDVIALVSAHRLARLFHRNFDALLFEDLDEHHNRRETPVIKPSSRPIQQHALYFSCIAPKLTKPHYLSCNLVMHAALRVL